MSERPGAWWKRRYSHIELRTSCGICGGTARSVRNHGHRIEPHQHANRDFLVEQLKDSR